MIVARKCSKEREKNMLEYQRKKLTKVVCNCCGREILVENEIVKEGVFCGRICWGYFSKRDGVEDSFELCENCYDDMVATFKIPIGRKASLELL